MLFEKNTRVLKQQMVTIPKEIRAKFEMEEGTYIKWVLDDNDVITIKPLVLKER